MLNVALVLCGCGRSDGSEIHESVACLMHLARLGAKVQCFAPDQPQADVIDHLRDTPMSESRNCLVEAARIARGNIKPLSELKASGYDAVVFPGGFGAAKNLCTFAKDGKAMTVKPDVERVVKDFHGAGKAIGLCCIAPVIAAKVLPGVTVTLGAEGDAPAAVRSWGSKHQVAPVDQAVVDESFKVATAPAYMYGDANPWQISQGIGEMIEATLRLASDAKGVRWNGPNVRDVIRGEAATA